LKQKYGIQDAYKNNEKLKKQPFVFARMNAATALGEQDQKI
jgi:hypothetical protein